MPKDSSARYYQKSKESFQKISKDIKIFLKMRKQEYVCEQYKNLLDDGKQSFVEYKKNITNFGNIKPLHK